MPVYNDLADAARRSGLTVWESPGWQQRNHGGMSGLRGIVCHHTGDSSADAWVVVRDGRPDLDGPLANFTLERDGSVRVICNGQAWHAGTGSWPSIGRNNGNAWCLGIECVYNGSDITDAQRDAYPRLVAALVAHCDIPVGNVIAHREWAPGRKVDPGQIDMPSFRRSVQTLATTGGATPSKEIEPMLEREFPEAGRYTGRVNCPTGTASSIVARSWVSVTCDGGGQLSVYFNKSADTDSASPGTANPWTGPWKNGMRVWAEIPDGTEYIWYQIDTKGPGCLTVEFQAK